MRAAPLLLDTHALLWLAADSQWLGSAARAEIGSASAVFVSVASLWEATIKVSAGKLVIEDGLTAIAEGYAVVTADREFELYPVTVINAGA